LKCFFFLIAVIGVSCFLVPFRLPYDPLEPLLKAIGLFKLLRKIIRSFCYGLFMMQFLISVSQLAFLLMILGIICKLFLKRIISDLQMERLELVNSKRDTILRKSEYKKTKDLYFYIRLRLFCSYTRYAALNRCGPMSLIMAFFILVMFGFATLTRWKVLPVTIYIIYPFGFVWAYFLGCMVIFPSIEDTFILSSEVLKLWISDHSENRLSLFNNKIIKSQLPLRICIGGNILKWKKGTRAKFAYQVLYYCVTLLITFP